MKKNIEIISLIFKSTQYLHFIVDKLKSELCKADGWDVGIRIVANDATPEVLDELKKIDIPYTIYNSPNPNEYYLNRVYKAYNFCVTSSNYDNVCLINSDMVFSDGWLDNLLKHHDGVNIPCSRLVESGKMGSGMHGINLLRHVGYNFGTHPNNFNLDGWLKYAETIKEDKPVENGLFMPCVFEKTRFIESGMYPEGNIYYDGIGTLHPSGTIQSGDDWYFRKLEKEYNMKHITVFDSLVYHIQEGEKDA